MTAIFHSKRTLYLASASPRRIAFLRALGLPVQVLIPPAHCEPLPRPGEKPEEFAPRAALSKARGVLPLLAEGPQAPRPLLIAADTVVVSQDRILGKPADPEEALAMLRDLAGTWHSVITGCALLAPGQADEPDLVPAPAQSFAQPAPHQAHIFAVHSRVRMWDCPEDILRVYAQSREPLDKAGAYAVQGAGAFLIRSLEGSWSNVVGLPLAELMQALLAIDAVGPVPDIPVLQ
ncbi:Maf family protein [Desulfovibrio sp. OttesenSCG-928-A18]|nr:Maf family protein [Desulfovibrio sp. OttesenSCG-928-A18]